jgi:hypothetical protein
MTVKNTYFFYCNQICSSLGNLPVVLNGIREDGRKVRSMWERLNKILFITDKLLPC